jgi:hypothetical protein
LYVKVFTPQLPGVSVFETFAAVSTIGFIVVFVFLFQADRRSRREQSGND